MPESLRGSLQSLAQGTPDISEFRTSLLPQIRSRRRKRQTITAAITVAAAGILTTGVIMGAQSFGPGPTEPAAPQAQGLTIGRCGSEITGQLRVDQPLQLAASVPTTPLKAVNPLLQVQIDMKVVNMSNSVLRIRTNASASLTLARDGVVVATPPPHRGAGSKYTIEPGESFSYKSTVSLRRCDSDSASSPVPPGTYQLYAVQPFFLGDDLAHPIFVQGGPWDLEVG
jgi:hypothetical protein